MKRISGPFGLPQSCAEMARPSGVFAETALNFCSCAWADVAREMRNAATDIPARWFQGDVQIIWRSSLINDARADGRSYEAVVQPRSDRSDRATASVHFLRRRGKEGPLTIFPPRSRPRS